MAFAVVGRTERKPSRFATQWKVGLAMATTVIIPARNEEKTIGKIVEVFMEHPETRENVWVGIDADTTDGTAVEVWDRLGFVWHTGERGKGQVVRKTAEIAARHAFTGQRLILCDGDYTGLTTDHIDKILTPTPGIVIGVPDWPEIEVPSRVTHSWPQVSGFRCIPWHLLPPDAHGYLLETQLNLAAIATRTPVRTIFMEGLKAPFQWPLSKKRKAELERDRQWGIDNGIF